MLQKHVVHVNTVRAHFVRAPGLSQRHLKVKTGSKAFWHNADTSVVSFMAGTQGGDPGLAAALLQALRWRLDKAISATDRCQVLSGYIQRDILLLRSVRLTSLSLELEFGYNCCVRLLPWYLCLQRLCAVVFVACNACGLCCHYNRHNHYRLCFCSRATEQDWGLPASISSNG